MNKRKPGRPKGAKQKIPPIKRVPITPRVLPETLTWINGQGKSQGKTIDELVKKERLKNDQKISDIQKQ